jgi:hypothetical protein
MALLGNFLAATLAEVTVPEVNKIVEFGSWTKHSISGMTEIVSPTLAA